MYKPLLAIRYLMRRRITILAILSVTVCVFMVVVVMTVMNGLVEDIEQKNHNFFGDCIISTESLVGFPYYDEFLAELDKADFIAGSTPVMTGVALLTRPGYDSNHIVNIMGLDIPRHIKATNFAETLHYHASDPLNTFIPTYETDRDGCVFGAEMLHYRDAVTGMYSFSPASPRFAVDLSCFPLTAKGTLARASTDVVNSKPLIYSDASFSGIVRLDENTIYLPLETMQLLCNAGSEKRVSAIYVKFVDGLDLNVGTKRVRDLWNGFVERKKDDSYANLLSHVNVQRWYVYRRAAIAPSQKEKSMMAMLFLLLGIITVFIVLVVFYMIISHKSKDIGILKSVGISTSSIVQVFLIFAAIIGIIGSTVGTVLGCILLVYVNPLEDWLYAKYGWQVWDRNVYAIGDIPNNIEPNVVAFIIASAIIACLIGALVPSLQAARKRPTEILQVNQL